MTIFQLYSASTVDDPATSDSLPRSDVLLRCVFRATPGSASDGYRASSTAVTRAAENVTVHCDATKILVDHFGSNDGQTFPVSHARLSREPGSCEYKALAASDGVAIERSLFPDALSAVAEETEDTLCTKLARDENQGSEKGPTSSRQRITRIKRPRKAPLTHLAEGDASRTGQQVCEQQRRGEGIRGSRSCLAATRTCWGARN